jgi:hypothetical protein
MPARGKITSLPPEIKADFDRMLVERNFSGYDEVADWLNERLAAAGLEITVSRSGVHRYGQGFAERLAAIKIATEQARAISETVGDDAGHMNDALISLVQEKLFDVLVNLQMDDQEQFGKVFPKLGVAVARLSRASVNQKKYMAEARKKADAAVAKIEEKLTERKLDPATLRAVREEIYGIF